jgi:hypothetical protein
MRSSAALAEYTNPANDGSTLSNAYIAEDQPTSDLTTAFKRAEKLTPADRLTLASEPKTWLINYANSSALSEDVASPIIPLHTAFKRTIHGKRSVNTLQEWEGFVEDVDEKFFSATLTDITDKTRDPEFAKIPFRTLQKSEFSFVKPGAIFHLIIGASKTAHGNRINETIIYFRRFTLPPMNPGKELADMIRRYRE